MITAGLKVSTPTDTTIVMTRTFPAPRTLVWDAMTRPELVRRYAEVTIQSVETRARRARAAAELIHVAGEDGQ